MFDFSSCIIRADSTTTRRLLDIEYGIRSSNAYSEHKAALIILLYVYVVMAATC